jgi:hypothetical protein
LPSIKRALICRATPPLGSPERKGSLGTRSTARKAERLISIARTSIRSHQRLASVRSHRRLTATCTLAGAGRCAVRATIAHATARKLKLVKQVRAARAHRRKPARPYTVASASGRLEHKGKITLRLRLSAKEARALRHVKRVTLTLVATSSAAEHRSRTARRTLTLR